MTRSTHKLHWLNQILCAALSILLVSCTGTTSKPQLSPEVSRPVEATVHLTPTPNLTTTATRVAGETQAAATATANAVETQTAMAATQTAKLRFDGLTTDDELMTRAREIALVYPDLQSFEPITVMRGGEVTYWTLAMN